MSDTSPMDQARASASGAAVHFESALTDTDIEVLAKTTLTARLEELQFAAGLLCNLCEDPDAAAAVWSVSHNTWRHPEQQGGDLKWGCGAARVLDRVAELMKSLE